MSPEKDDGSLEFFPNFPGRNSILNHCFLFTAVQILANAALPKSIDFVCDQYTSTTQAVISYSAGVFNAFSGALGWGADMGIKLAERKLHECILTPICDRIPICERRIGS